MVTCLSAGYGVLSMAAHLQRPSRAQAPRYEIWGAWSFWLWGPLLGRCIPRAVPDSWVMRVRLLQHCKQLACGCPVPLLQQQLAQRFLHTHVRLAR